VLALLVAALPAHADSTVDTITYRAKQGDTLGMIAAEYYGDRTKTIFLKVENKIERVRTLRPGERLRIPINREITTAPGDTFETLAGTYLGNARRGVFLAEFNHMSPEDRLPAGTQLQVPFTVTHTTDGRESLASIATTYLHDSKRGELLQRYNFLEKSVLDKGESIVVPINNVRLQAAKMPPVDAEAKQRRATRRDIAQRAANALPRAWQAWRAGEYARILTLVIDLDPDYLDTAEAVDLGMLRGLAHAADGKLELAKEDFKAVRARNEAHVLRRFDYSPKIVELWEEVGGQAQ
jgi:LysM repeat protein